nr:unnamed protein product [Callosobruchus analis]
MPSSESFAFEQIAQEVSDRNVRKRNLIVYGVTEHAKPHSRQARVTDTEQYFNGIDIDSIKPQRLGKLYDGGRPRANKITLKDEADVISLIRGAAKLKNYTAYSRICISFDRTSRQIQCYKKVKQELDERIASGEADLKIKYVNQLYTAVLASEYDIIVLAETWLRNGVLSSELFPPEFSVVRCDPDLAKTNTKSGGGVRMLDLLVSDMGVQTVRDTSPLIHEDLYHPLLSIVCDISSETVNIECNPSSFYYNFRKANYIGLYNALIYLG